MNKSLLIMTLSSFTALMIASPLRADNSIKLGDAVQKALQNNHQLKAMEYEAEATQTDIGLARSGFMPQLNLTQTFQRTNNSPQSFFFKLNERQLDMQNTDFNNPGTNTDFETKLQLVQPLYTGGKLSASLEMAKKEHQASLRQVDRTADEISYQAAQAWYNLKVAMKFKEVAIMAVKDATSHYRIAQAFFEEGKGTKSDMLRARVFLSEMEQNQVKASTQVRIAGRALALALGESPDGELSAEGDLVYLPVSVNMEESINEGLVSRSELKELSLRQDQIDLQRQVAHADYLPSIALVGQVQMNSENTPLKDDADSWYGGLVITYPLFDGFARDYKMKKTQASKRRLLELKEQTSQYVSFQISQAVLKLEDASKRVELTRNTVAESEESLRLTELRYQNGLSTLTDLNDAQTALNQSRVNEIQAIAEYHLALIGLDYSKGILASKYSSVKNNEPK